MSLLKSVRTVARLESSEFRINVFNDIASRSALIRSVLGVHALLRRMGLSYLLVAVYGMAYYLRAGLPGTTPRWLAVAYHLNEIKQFDDLDQLMGEVKPARVSWSFAQTGSACALFRALCHPGDVLRFMRIFRRIERKLHFMPACRVAVMWFLYVRFRVWLDQHRVRAVLVTSDYSPDPVALSTAAAALGIPRIYIPHALPGYNLGLRTLLDFEWYIFDSQVMRDRFAARQPLTGKVLYRGVVGPTRPMALERLKPSGLRVGIFLTGPTEMEVLEDTIRKLARLSPPVILIRGHPVSFSNPDFTGLEQRYANVRISRGTALSEDIAACDLMISGNSTVFIETLKQGTPSAYMGALDFFPYDINGFVKEGLVPAIASADEINIEKLKSFFQPPWEQRMACFDASYGQDVRRMKEELRKELLHIIESSV